MPSKITADVGEAKAVSLTTTPKSYDTSMTREFMAQGVQAGAETLAYHFDRTNLRNAEEDIGAAAADAASANQAYAGQKELLLQTMMSNDEEVVKRAENELNELRAAREQGVMSGQERELRVNSLVKWYANQYPHLGAQVRAIGSAANDNITAATRAANGTDPIEEGRNNVIAKAYELGITPAKYIETARMEKQYDLNEKAGKALAYSQNATKEQIARGLYDDLTSFQTNRGYNILRELEGVAKTGKMPHSDQLMALLESNRMSDKQLYARKRNEYQQAGGVMLDVETANAMDRQIDSFYDSLKVQVGGLKTTDQIAKWATAAADQLLAEGRERFSSVAASKGNFQALLAAKSPEAFNSWVFAGGQTMMNRERFARTQGSQAAGDEHFMTIFKDNPEQMAMFKLAQDGSLDDLLAAAYVAGWDNGIPASQVTSNPALIQKSKQITLDTYDRLPWNERSKATQNVVSSLDYNDINQSPVLIQDIPSNAQATGLYIEKATRQAMDWVGEPGTRTEMVVNLSNYNMPISYKYGTNSGSGIENIQNINKMYRQVRDMFGAKGAMEWINALGEHGVTIQDTYVPPQPTTGPTKSGPSNPRTSSLREAAATPAEGSKASTEASALVDKFTKYGKQFGVPENVTRAFAKIESSSGKNLVGPETSQGRAMGVAAMTQPRFDLINEAQFNGRLVWGDQDDMALASAAHLGALSQKYQGNIKNMAGEYHGGEGWAPGKSDGNMTTQEYMDAVEAASR